MARLPVLLKQRPAEAGRQPWTWPSAARAGKDAALKFGSKIGNTVEQRVVLHVKVLRRHPLGGAAAASPLLSTPAERARRSDFYMRSVLQSFALCFPLPDIPHTEKQPSSKTFSI